jgi:hypothetical protein
MLNRTSTQSYSIGGLNTQRQRQKSQRILEQSMHIISPELPMLHSNNDSMKYIEHEELQKSDGKNQNILD